jgi:hypothetical protein
VFLPVGGVLSLIPFKAPTLHIHCVYTLPHFGKKKKKR